MTFLVLQALNGLNYNIECVIGNANLDKKKIIEYCSNKSNINVHIQTNHIAAIMHECDFAIGAFGQNTYERLYMNLPTIGIELADNQRLIADYCEKNNLAINLGWWKNVTKLQILNNLIRYMNIEKIIIDSHINIIEVLYKI
jgi:spore coat polysaccharide biosynthesis predicted glycosyltransferase SpsG